VVVGLPARRNRMLKPAPTLGLFAGGPLDPRSVGGMFGRSSACGTYVRGRVTQPFGGTEDLAGEGVFCVLIFVSVSSAREGKARTEDLSVRTAQGETDADTPDTARRRAWGHPWADLMRRTFGFDYPGLCAVRGASAHDRPDDRAPMIQQIRPHFGLLSEILAPTSARVPPLALDATPPPFDDAITIYAVIARRRA
jgi:hypothetical protein